MAERCIAKTDAAATPVGTEVRKAIKKDGHVVVTRRQGQTRNVGPCLACASKEVRCKTLESRRHGAKLQPCHSTGAKKWCGPYPGEQPVGAFSRKEDGLPVFQVVKQSKL